MTRAVEAATAPPRAGEVALSVGTRSVLFITFHFPPSVEVGAYSCAQIARHLPSCGWEPIVLAATERNYGPSDRRVQPTAAVIRVPAVPNPLVVYRRIRDRLPRRAATPPIPGEPEGPSARGAGLARSVAALLDTPDLYLGWLAPAVFSGLRACRRLGIRQLLSSGPCWTNHLVGLLIARRTRLPWTAHFRDPWVRDGNTGGAARRIDAALERAVVTRARSVVCVTARHTELLRRRYPDVAAERFVTIPNGYDEVEWNGVAEEVGSTAPKARFVITHAGTVYSDRSPEPVFRALRRLADGGEIDIARVEVDLVGWWEPGQREGIEAMAARWGVGQCARARGPLTKAETLRRLTDSSLLLLLAENWTLQVPAKTYEYLRAGRPVLALTPADGAVADLLRATGGGWVVDPADEVAMAEAIGEAYRGWSAGRSPRTPDPGVVARFDRALLVRDLAAVLDTARG